MRNVTDHQIDRRVSELEAHSRKQPRLSFPALSSPSFYNKAATPSQIRTPRIGSTTRMSSTPSQQTPDLPQPSSVVNASDRAKISTRTPPPPRNLGSPMQLSSPPATAIRHSHSHSREIGEGAQGDGEGSTREGLSPSQRGDAVDGLLKLMNTADRHDTPNTWSG